MPYSRPLSASEIHDALQALPSWSVRDDRASCARAFSAGRGFCHAAQDLRKTFTLPSFRASLAFVNQVAELAEGADHHPTLTIAFKRVTVVLTTWAARGKVTAKDVQLAQQIEALSRQWSEGA